MQQATDKSLKQLSASEDKNADYADKIDTVKEMLMQFLEKLPLGYV
jgi:hypothetical protein